jgi:ATP-dependent DNA ligase
MTPDATTPGPLEAAGRFTVEPPVEPMLAKPIAGLPDSAEGLAFQPKWDGFRVLIYRRGDDVVIQGRMRAADAAATGKWDLTYLFPEMVDRIRALSADDVVLDGELVVIRDGRLAFDALQGRLRPRNEEGGWKIAQLAADHPTSFVAFDVLGRAGRDLRSAPFQERREELQGALADAAPPIYVTPQTSDLEEAARWFAELPGAGLDGLIARPTSGAYAPGKRALFKIKPTHTVDVVCAGWRPFAKPGPDGQEVVGSVLLGLYDDAGVLQMIGAMSAFSMAVRVELAEQLAELAADEAHPWFQGQGRVPDMPSRWSSGKTRAWHALRPELVAEVSYDQVESGRLRHVARFVRWRPDKDPRECTMDGLAVPEPLDIQRVLTARV